MGWGGSDLSCLLRKQRLTCATLPVHAELLRLPESLPGAGAPPQAGLWLYPQGRLREGRRQLWAVAAGASFLASPQSVYLHNPRLCPKRNKRGRLDMGRNDRLQRFYKCGGLFQENVKRVCLKLLARWGSGPLSEQRLPSDPLNRRGPPQPQGVCQAPGT